MPRPLPAFFLRSSLTLLAVTVLIYGCGGAGLLSSYNDPTAEGHRLDRIAVLAFHPNPEVKAKFEKDFADYLRKRGNDAVEANTLASGTIEPTREALKELVVAEKLDGVFTVRVLRTDPRQEGNAQKTAYRPDRDGDLYQYFFQTRRSMVPDGQVADDALIYLEGRLYKTSDAQVAWGGLTASQNDQDLNKFTQQYADAAVFAMAAKGYVN